MYYRTIATELGVRPHQVAAAADLLATGATVPFIARYRKEATGSLDEVSVAAVRDRLGRLAELDKRREAVLRSLTERELLTEDLRAALEGAGTLSEVEDLYLPFRPKRRTRATIARERGLEPLARRLFAQDTVAGPSAEEATSQVPDAIPTAASVPGTATAGPTSSPDSLPTRPTATPAELLAAAAAFVDAERGVPTAEDALAGARDIIAEWVNEDAAARARLRLLFSHRGAMVSHVGRGKEEEGVKFRDYFDWQEPASTAPSHRVLAMLRGEKEGFLVLRVEPPEEEALPLLEQQFVTGRGPASEQVRLATEDSYRRLLGPSLETEARVELKRRADEEAIRVFAANVRELLLAPPLGQKAVLAVDPGFRTGCKLAALDAQGNLLEHDTIFPHQSERLRTAAGERVLQLVSAYGIEAVAVGNGTAGRETETFLRTLDLPSSVVVVMVNESGASIYSASDAAREEFPDHDVTVRGAVSIGRRLQDPLSELVKIDPKSIGVGQYQHDVDQPALRHALDDVVMSCVNSVGVEVNLASRQLLSYVSGLGPQLAANIVAHRIANGPFRSRAELRKVPRLGPKAFEQAAGFLRIHDASNPLDAGAVHPESYPVVQAMARDLGHTVPDLLRESALRAQIDLNRYATDTIGLPTLTDILAELARPGRDPRERFEAFSFAPGIEKLEDLEPGMRLPGIVTNVTKFGAFVDVGVHQDGLVHVSKLADRFVRDPAEVVKVGQRVEVSVLEVDLKRRRISLSMRGLAGDAETR
ncbi:MAG: RNA-binding transcriptional accessory protein [Actinobacteria bacterium]|nr:RNA-binding transcriptional accessory protein [Actinomycetota bacterium]